ncbi:MAG: hypothetical protein A2017_10755 [Lentisphaerae bacterium GWF2_44_16]|nr:MAG: hypothetical protein A2017_10755 [Lentisphaerae bacterium GWF2_44_16]
MRRFFLKKTVMTCFAAGLLLAVCSCGSPVRKSEFKYPDKDSMAAFEKVGAKLDVEFKKIDEKLSSAAAVVEKTGLEGERPRAILASIVTGSRCVISGCIINDKGVVKIAEPAGFQSLEGKDFSAQSHVKTVLSEGKPVMSGVFKAEEGFESVVFAYPVKTEDGKVAGCITALIRPNFFLATFIIPEIETNPLNIWAMQTDGMILYDRDSQEIGRNIFEDSYFQPYPALRGLARRICNETRGSGNYFYPSKGAKVMIEKNARWVSVGLYGRVWRLIMNLEDTSE